MRSKRISSDEQYRLIMECRQSGLSDYQWDINPGTFYNWISRLRKHGQAIPASSCQTKQHFSSPQEVVKVELVTDPDSVPAQMEQNTRMAVNLANDISPAVEIRIGNATIRFFNGTEHNLVETTLKCLGGALHVR
jgi:transposase-like protein